MRGLRLYIKVDSYMAHMFYACSLSNNTLLPIAINKSKYFISFNTYIAVFDLVASNSNKIELKN